jgi:hypothetical protein
MAIVQISKIIQKQGDLADLPQLDVAEIGYATDAKRLFIGDELPNTPDPALLYNTEVLTQNSVDGTSIIYDPITGVISSVGGGGGGGGTVTSVNVSGGTTGLTTTGGPILTAGTITLGGVLSVAHGGTGANNSNSALTNLLPFNSNNANSYLYTDGNTISWQSSSNVLTTILPVSSNVANSYLYTNGNSIYWTSSSNVLISIMPSIVGNTNTYLYTDGNTIFWQTANGIGGGAAGSNNEIQYNISGALAASNTLTYDPQADVFTVGDLSADSLIESGNGQGMMISANQALTLQSASDSIALSLPAGTGNKITVIGPTANDYATSLSSSDLANKQYVDNYVANAISGSAYTLPTASTTVLGGVKIDGTTITIDGNGVISANTGGGGSFVFPPPTGTSFVFVPNNQVSAPIVHNLGRIPAIILWVPESQVNFGPPDTYNPYAYDLIEVTDTIFRVAAGGSGGNVYYAYW